MLRIFLLLTFPVFILSGISNAQSLEILNKIELTYRPSKASVDKNGNIYLASKSGNIYKYDKNGDSLASFSPQKKAEITLLEAWNELKVFVFFQDLQEYILLDRFLRPSPYYTFDTDNITFVSIATQGSDENIWILDPTDFSIKKYNSHSNQIELNTPLDLTLPSEDYNITFIREYQNIVFVSDSKTGIHLLDNLGNYKTKIPVTGINHIGFYKNNMYFFEGNDIHLRDLYKDYTYTLSIPSDLEISPEWVLLSPGRVDLIGKNQMFILKMYE